MMNIFGFCCMLFMTDGIPGLWFYSKKNLKSRKTVCYEKYKFYQKQERMDNYICHSKISHAREKH